MAPVSFMKERINTHDICERNITVTVFCTNWKYALKSKGVLKWKNLTTSFMAVLRGENEQNLQTTHYKFL